MPIPKEVIPEFLAVKGAIPVVTPREGYWIKRNFDPARSMHPFDRGKRVPSYGQDERASRAVRAIPVLSGTAEDRLRFLYKIRRAFEQVAAELNLPLWAFTDLFRVRIEINAKPARVNGTDKMKRPWEFPPWRSYTWPDYQALRAWAIPSIQAVAIGKRKELGRLPWSMGKHLPELHLIGGQGIPEAVTPDELVLLGEAFRMTTERVPGLTLWVKGVGEPGPGLLRMAGGQVHATDLQVIEYRYEEPWDLPEMRGKVSPCWATLLCEDVAAFIRSSRWMKRQKDPWRALLQMPKEPSRFQRLLERFRRSRNEHRTSLQVEDLGAMAAGGAPVAERIQRQLALEDRVQAPDYATWNLAEAARLTLLK